MTAAEFKKKWSRYQGKETSAYQEHFSDLCRLLGQATPAQADPSGTDLFCFQKRVVKDAELFDLHETPDASQPNERGFADVWKKGCFAWEYKGKKKNLEAAYKQLLRYRESLLNPPLLVVCDFDRYIIKTNFNGTVQEVYEFTNDQIDRRDNLRTLRALFEKPDFLKPQRTTAQVTEKVAAQIAAVAQSLQSRESVELADAKTRAEVTVAQRKNLRIARFLNRIVFCLFAQYTGLLPPGIFTEITKTGLDDPKLFAETLENLFAVMAKGGTFGKDKIRCFNGHLFEEASVFELTETELRQLADAGEADWQFIEPSIMGTLFERAMDESQRSQLGAHYTSEADIKTLVEPVLMQPFRREWAIIKGELAAAYVSGKGNAAQRERLAKFQKKLSAVTVLDPACGSGNFLYVSLQLLLGLEKEVITFATQLGFAFKPQVSVPQLKAIEINPYAFELAQVSVQIGYLQWRRDNGFDNDRTPVLQVLDGFQNEDALLVPHFRSKPKTLKEAQAREHKGDDALRFYREREWPESDVIVGNPPFLGGSKLWEELGRHYQKELWKIYEGRVPGSADLCCYWFEKARQQIEQGKCKRAGLLATQGIRGGASRQVLESIKRTGDIFFAVSDEAWILAGADVRVSMIGFDNGSEKCRTLDGKQEENINANLTATTDVTEAKLLKANHRTCFQGSQKIGSFQISEQLAIEWLKAPNTHGKPNSNVLKRSWNGLDVARRSRDCWMIDFGTEMPVEEATLYEKPFQYALELVKPKRDKNNREAYRKYWWRHGEPRIAMRAATKSLRRFIATPEVTKHRIFAWLDGVILPDKKLMVVAKADDYFFGVLHSHIHELWALAQCTWHGIGNDPRYTPTTCFETFPFPFRDDMRPPEAPQKLPPSKPRQSEPDRSYAENLAAKNYFMGKEEPTPYGGSRKTPDEYRDEIATAAKELNELRERWLNPPEWTVERFLEFPGSADGPWAHYVVNPDEKGIGTVRYPRLEPRDADCAAKLKKRTLTKLYNERPAWLDFAHKKLDTAVAAAYGWPADLSDEQILERLLALNLEQAEAEAKAAKVEKPITSRAKHTDELL
jgi:type II restriction/modification system DNA methylase subunit YeeA